MTDHVQRNLGIGTAASELERMGCVLYSMSERIPGHSFYALDKLCILARFLVSGYWSP